MVWQFGLTNIENAWWDLRFGGIAGPTRGSRYSHLGAHGVRNVSYRPLEKLFSHLRIYPDDVLVDVGCGKGRVLNYWLRSGLPNKLVGLEIDEAVAADVRNRLRHHRNVEIITGSAVETVPDGASVLFMYNPFDEVVMSAFRDRLATHRGRGKRVAIIYYAPRYVDVFRKDPHWDVRRLDTGIYEPADLITLKDAMPT